MAGCNQFTRLPPKTTRPKKHQAWYRRKVRRSFQFPEPLLISWHSKILRRPSNNGEPQTALKTLLKFHSPPRRQHSATLRAERRLWSPSGISRFWQALSLLWGPNFPKAALRRSAAAGANLCHLEEFISGRQFALAGSCRKTEPWSHPTHGSEELRHNSNSGIVPLPPPSVKRARARFCA